MGLDTGAFTLLPLRLQSARADLRHLRGALRGPVHQQLHARGRADARRHAAGDRDDPRVSCKDCPHDARRHGAAAEPQPHLRRPHQGRGRADQGGGDQPQRQRPDRPGQRRDPRSAQGRAVPGLRATSISRSAAPTAGDCFARYLVRMAEMLREPEDHPAGGREPARRAGQRGRGRAGDAAATSRRSTRRSKG